MSLYEILVFCLSLPFIGVLCWSVYQFGAYHRDLRRALDE